MAKLSEGDEKFAYYFHNNQDVYHHHKEQMAYIGFLIQTAFFTAIMTINWNQNDADTSSLTPVMMLAFVVPFWIFIHVFIRWQLRLRRLAAIKSATILRVILKNLDVNNKEIERNENHTKQQNNTDCSKSCWLSIVDRFLWPVSSSLVESDIKIAEYPNWFQKEFNSRLTEGTGAHAGEILVTCGSWIILIGMIVKLTVLSY